MDDWGERMRPRVWFPAPSLETSGKVFDEGVEHDSRGRLCSPFRMPQGQRVAPARRTKLGEDGNQMQADGNSFPEFILGWTIGANLPLAEIPFPATIAL